MNGRHAPELRAKLVSMTPDELRARITPATMRKLRGCQALLVFFLLLLSADAALFVAQLFGFARAASSPTGVLTWPNVAVFGGTASALTGLGWCRARLTKLIEGDLLQSLKKDAAKT